MTRRLLVLAMDQRPWLTQALYGHTGVATVTERSAICDAKHLVLDGLLAALDRPDAVVAREDAAVLIDQELGAGVAERARAQGVAVSMPVERGGLEVYETEPDDLAGFLRRHAPELTKVLVRYNPDGDAAANAVQRSRLAEVSRLSRSVGSRFLFELLVPATADQLAAVGGDVTRYEAELRPRLTLAAMREIVADIAVDVWKLEHMAVPEHYRAASDLAHAHGGCCILLGANAPATTVDSWLRDAAASGFVGFAVGRSIWWDAVRGYLAGEIERDDAIAVVAERYGRFARTFLSACAPSS